MSLILSLNTTITNSTFTHNYHSENLELTPVLSSLAKMIFFVFLFLSMVEGTMFHLERIPSPVDFVLAEVPFIPLYTTTVKIGHPPQVFSVIIDTGSDVCWLPCQSCSVNCPEAMVRRYDPNFSTTKTFVSCPQKFCQCSTNNTCAFGITYEDNSTISGYFVQDRFLIESNQSETLFNFGCTTFESGSLLSQGKGFDGLFGFGRGPNSLPSQLRLNAFSYCFNKNIKNGYLFFGEVIHSDLTYTPMVPFMQNYVLNLEKILVAGQALPIAPVIFKPSKHQVGTVIDSGTSNFLLIEEAYDELINAVKSFLPVTAIQKTHGRFDCFTLSSSTSEAFPVVTLVFSENATLVLPPSQYLMEFGSNIVDNNTNTWCIGIAKWKDITILGGFIFQNKLIVYDLARERIGWTNFDCSISDKELSIDLHYINRNKSSRHQQNVRYKDVMYMVLLTFVILFHY